MMTDGRPNTDSLTPEETAEFARGAEPGDIVRVNQEDPLTVVSASHSDGRLVLVDETDERYTVEDNDGQTILAPDGSEGDNSRVTDLRFERKERFHPGEIYTGWSTVIIVRTVDASGENGLVEYTSITFSNGNSEVATCEESLRKMKRDQFDDRITFRDTIFLGEQHIYRDQNEEENVFFESIHPECIHRYDVGGENRAVISLSKIAREFENRYGYLGERSDIQSD